MKTYLLLLSTQEVGHTKTIQVKQTVAENAKNLLRSKVNAMGIQLESEMPPGLD